MSYRIGVLVLVHKNLSQLRDLCAHLAADFSVFVHIDKKADFSPGDLSDLTGVQAISTREVTWGSFAMVSATLDLLRLAVSEEIDRVVLISGQDLPLKTNKAIRAFYETHPEVNFIESLNLRDWDAGGMDRIVLWHSKSPVGSQGLYNFALRALGFTLHKTQKILRVSRRLDWDFYCGPQWFDLTGETASQILNLVDQNPRFLRRFRGTACSDEIFFQTAIHYLGLEQTCADLTTRYIDWASGPEFPRLLRADDLPTLAGSEALFARKFDPTVDPFAAKCVWESLRISPA